MYGRHNGNMESLHVGGNIAQMISSLLGQRPHSAQLLSAPMQAQDNRRLNVGMGCQHSLGVFTYACVNIAKIISSLLWLYVRSIQSHNALTLVCMSTGCEKKRLKETGEHLGNIFRSCVTSFPLPDDI